MKPEVATAQPREQGTRELRLPRLLSATLERAWRTGLLPEPTLDADELIETATRAEKRGIDKEEWQVGFRLLTEDLQSCAHLHAFGRTIAHGQLIGLLRQRIRARRVLRAEPARPFRRPVIILGQMRSGTTLLHRMLASDRRFSYTRLHETLAPLSQSRLRGVASAAMVQALLNACNRNLKSIHPTSPLSAEEEFGLHALSFHGAMFSAQWNVPAFSSWCEQRDLRPVYSEFSRLLQMLRRARRESVEKIQLLKAPQFMEDLGEVLRTFPDARLVWIRRDLADVAASTGSLVMNQRQIQSHRVDPRAIGQEWLRKIHLREERATDALRQNPSIQAMYIDYSSLLRQPAHEIARIYRFLGLDLPRAVARNIGRVASRRAGPAHVYSPATFGLNGASVPGQPR